MKGAAMGWSALGADQDAFSRRKTRPMTYWKTKAGPPPFPFPAACVPLCTPYLPWSSGEPRQYQMAKVGDESFLSWPSGWAGRSEFKAIPSGGVVSRQDPG